MKKCTGCSTIKNDTEFYKDNRNISGLYSICKRCHRYKYKESIKKWRKKYPEKNRKISRDSYKKNRISVLEKMSKYQKDNPDVANSHTKVYLAIKNGLMVRPNKCSICGLKVKIDGHHNDYSKPLEVEWVCRVCHKDIHSKKL